MRDKIFFVILVFAVIAMIGINIYDHIVAEKPICVWCHKPIWNDEIEVQYEPKREVHREPCNRELVDLTEEEFDNEWSGDRLKEMNRLIDEKWNPPKNK